MDLKAYYNDVQQLENKFNREHPDQVVHVTSVYHRERGSTPGAVASANPRNAARVIADGTHREATEEEIASYYERQDEEFKRNARAEERKGQKQYVVVASPDIDREPGPRVTVSHKAPGPEISILPPAAKAPGSKPSDGKPLVTTVKVVSTESPS
jgi:hypothetical protein